VSAGWLSATVRTKLQVAADRAAEAALRSVGEQLLHLREDAGLPRTTVAQAAGIHPSYLRLIELGRRDPSTTILTRIAAALGADVGLRVFPRSGPALRDRFQARLIEALLQLLPADWTPYPEVPVSRPVRGTVDLVAVRPATSQVVSIEAQSEIRRLEQQMRWAAEKTDALPSATIWPEVLRTCLGRPQVSRILVLRSTVATRSLARSFAATLTAAYPAAPRDLRAALLDPKAPWPGSGILWMKVDGSETTMLRGAPRGVQRD